MTSELWAVHRRGAAVRVTAKAIATQHSARKSEAIGVHAPWHISSTDAQRCTRSSNRYSLLFTSQTVDDFVAVKAHDFNRVQQLSTSSPQQVQQQSLGTYWILQVSISLRIWFGTRGLEVQILSPRPFTLKVQPGHMGYTMYRLHGWHFWPEGIL